MSFLARIFPWLFDEVGPSAAGVPKGTARHDASGRIDAVLNAEEPQMDELMALAQHSDTDIRTLLSERIARLVAREDLTHHPDNARLLLESLHVLAEDPLTDVRVALASALKDVAKTPHAIARKLAHDAERAVAEPIIRYSLSLSDEDLLNLIKAHPQSWQTVMIAGRKRVSHLVSDAVIDTGNIVAGNALIANDGAVIHEKTHARLLQDPAYQAAMLHRQSLVRRMKRDWIVLADRSLYTFLRHKARLDKKTTRQVMDTMYRRIDTTHSFETIPPGDLTEEQLKDALLLGENKIVLDALAARTQSDPDVVQRMLVTAQAAKPVIALCALAQLSPQFSVLVQQRIARLSPEKILYPKDGENWPLSQEDMQWQLEFFGVASP